MRIDPRVLEAQQWVNTMYGGKPGYVPVTEDGLTGNEVVEALIWGLQMELGIASPTGYFGSATAAAYDNNRISKGSVDTSDRHFVKILQHGLFCKGYNPSAATGTFGDNTEAAIIKLQRDAGLSDNQISTVVTSTIFRTVLSTDALALVPKGDPIIRSIQQDLNSKYLNYIGIMPCDGVYGAGLATSLVYALQAEGGLSTSVANGNFGPATQTIATNHPQSPSASETNFVLIAKYALYCNGIRRNAPNAFDTSVNGEFNGAYTSEVTAAVEAFQRFAGIMEVTGTIGIKEWMSLMVSTGYPQRNVLACDTATQITDIKAQRIYANDFRIIGRYLTGGTVSAPKNLTRSELEILFNRGISVFAIYQDEREFYQTHPNEYTTANYYNYAQGYYDAGKACMAAAALGIPHGEYIFFSVDYDFMDAEVTSKIIPHFQGINAYLREQGRKYKIGIYGPRNICTRVSNLSYAELSFVSDMSTGFSGNRGYALPENWAFDQIREYTQGAADGGFALDCVAASGLYMGFDSIVPQGVVQPDFSSEELSLNFYKTVLTCLGLGGVSQTLQFDRKYALDMGYFIVEVEGKYGAKVDIETSLPLPELSIVNGEITKQSWTIAKEAIGMISTEMSLELTRDGEPKFVSDLKWHIKNGYVAIGYEIGLAGTFEVSYVIHKDASIEEGLTAFTEIGIKLISKTALSDEERASFEALAAVCADLKNDTDIDWEEVGQIIFAILVIVFVAGVLICTAPILFLEAAMLLVVVLPLLTE